MSEYNTEKSLLLLSALREIDLWQVTKYTKYWEGYYEMKAKALLLGLMLITTLLLAACNTDTQAADKNITGQTDEGVLPRIFIDESKDGQTIEVVAGCLVTITLESNATTGFRWELAEPIDEGMLALIDSKYTTAEEEDGDEPVTGAGGTEEWTFETLQPGDSTISMAYSRPWEGGEKGVKTFNVTIRSLSGRTP